MTTKKVELSPPEIRRVLLSVGRKKKPFKETSKWKLAVGLNQRVSGPLLNGRSKIEPVVKFGGKRKPRKKG
jgi:hypothetical protein